MGEAVDESGFRLMARLWDRTALGLGRRAASEGSGGKACVWACVSIVSGPVFVGGGGAGRGGKAPSAPGDEAAVVSEKVGGRPLAGNVVSRGAMAMIWRRAVRRLRLYRQCAFMAQGARSIGLQQRVAIDGGNQLTPWGKSLVCRTREVRRERRADQFFADCRLQIGLPFPEKGRSEQRGRRLALACLLVPSYRCRGPATEGGPRARGWRWRPGVPRASIAADFLLELEDEEMTGPPWAPSQSRARLGQVCLVPCMPRAARATPVSVRPPSLLSIALPRNAGTD